MSYIKKNIWSIGFVVVLVGAFGAMALASKHSDIPSSTGTAADTIDFTISPTDHVEGPATAKVTLVEFADFQCPACGAYYPLIERLHADYPNDVQIVYKYFPLKTIHFQAQNAAQAAESAGMQGKFWEMYSKLYTTQNDWANTAGLSPFDAYATELGLDMAKYKADVDSDAVKDRIQADIKYGNSIGVNATPTFYINGKKIANPQSYEALQALVEAEGAVAGATLNATLDTNTAPVQ